MRKFMLLLCLVFVSCPLLIAVSQQGTMNISGFYTAPARPVVLSVWDYNDIRLYSTTTSINSDHLGATAQEVFHWALEGDISNGDELSFTFSTFQARVNDVYYRPAYTIEYELENGDVFSLASGTNLSNNKINATKASGASAYNTQYTFVFRSASSGTESAGQFLMRVSDYYGKANNEDIEATFNYRCDVIVTYTSGV